MARYGHMRMMMDAMFDFWVGMFLECFVAELDLLLPWTII
jgi:hypothetical protein